MLVSELTKPESHSKSNLVVVSVNLLSRGICTLCKCSSYSLMGAFQCAMSTLYAEVDAKKGKEEKPEPEANFALSGKLAAESNTVNGVVLVHQEPPESRQPSQMWRLYGFKNGQSHSAPVLESLVRV